MMDGKSGDEIAHIPVDEPFRRRFGNPYVIVHRADLHGVLLDACRAQENVTLVNSQRVIAYENTSNGDFLLDKHPDFENVWLAGGGSGHGFKHGPAVGEYLVARLTGAAAPVVEPRYSLASKGTKQSRAVY